MGVMDVGGFPSSAQSTRPRVGVRRRRTFRPRPSPETGVSTHQDSGGPSTGRGTTNYPGSDLRKAQCPRGRRRLPGRFCPPSSSPLLLVRKFPGTRPVEFLLLFPGGVSPWQRLSRTRRPCLGGRGHGRARDIDVPGKTSSPRRTDPLTRNDGPGSMTSVKPQDGGTPPPGAPLLSVRGWNRTREGRERRSRNEGPSPRGESIKETSRSRKTPSGSWWVGSYLVPVTTPGRGTSTVVYVRVRRVPIPVTRSSGPSSVDIGSDGLLCQTPETPRLTSSSTVTLPPPSPLTPLRVRFARATRFWNLRQRRLRGSDSWGHGRVVGGPHLGIVL